jgi:DNA-binding response OmpR family regulator
MALHLTIAPERPPPRPRVRPAPPPLRRKAVLVLNYLRERQNRHVSTAELMSRFWVASSHRQNVGVTISRIRDYLAVHEPGTELETVKTVGYRLVRR